MGYLGEEIKKLGFGLMRLPQKDGKIDIEQTKEMVDLFLEAGFTPLGLMQAAKMQFVRRSSRDTPANVISLQRKTPHGSAVRRGKKRLLNSIPR